LTAPDASIIILTKNGGGNFPRLLESIYSQKYAGTFEVIMIDSGSTDGTLQAAAGYPVRLLQIAPEQFHHARTRNLGAGMALGKYLAFITQDALPLNDQWLHQLIYDFSDPEVGMVVGWQIPWDHVKPPEKFFYHYYFPDSRLIVQQGVSAGYRGNMFISNANSALRRELWQKLNFSEDMFIGEDKELAWRILAAGGSIVYEPGAAVRHSHGHGLAETFSRQLDFGFAVRRGAADMLGSGGWPVKRMLDYLGAEMSYLRSNNWTLWIPYSIIYEIFRYAGFLLGKWGARGLLARKIDN